MVQHGYLLVNDPIRLYTKVSALFFRANVAGPHGYYPADQRTSYAYPHAGENTRDVEPGLEKGSGDENAAKQRR